MRRYGDVQEKEGGIKGLKKYIRQQRMSRMQQQQKKNGLTYENNLK